MATIKAHGGAIGKVEFITDVRTYCADGTILIDRGDGLKVYGKMKPGFTGADGLRFAQENLRKWQENNPEAAAYADKLHDVCGRRHWRTVDLAISISYTDPDGAWIDLADLANIDLDFEDVKDLCKLYAARVEARNRVPGK